MNTCMASEQGSESESQQAAGAVRHRPGTASNLSQPASLLGAVADCNEEGNKRSAANTSNGAPGSKAVAGSGAFSTSNAAIARLKAELAELVAVGNVQLQSLKPMRATKAAADNVDASAALKAQVLLHSTQLTYSEARAAAVDAKKREHAEPMTGLLELNDTNRSKQQQPTYAFSNTQQTEACTGSSTGNANALSAFMADMQLTADEAAAAAAASALKEMRGWVAEQDMRTVQPSVAARIPNRVVAARISMLQSETQVLQYQRQFYEAALDQLRGSAVASKGAQHQQQQHGAEHASNSNEDGDNACRMQKQSSAGPAVCPLPTKQRLHHNHSFSGWAAQHTSDQQDLSHVSNIMEDTTTVDTPPILLEPCYSSDAELSYSDDDDAGHKVQQSAADTTTGRAATNSDKRTGRRLLLRAISGLAAASGCERVCQRGTDDYFGSSCLHTRTSLRRSVSSNSDVLQLSHSGLRPQQLDKVAAALAAAPWIRKLDLSGNMLTDAAIADLALMLLTNSEAAAVTHIDVSQNQLLTWRCCSALQQLLCADHSNNNSCQREDTIMWQFRELSSNASLTPSSSTSGKHQQIAPMQGVSAGHLPASSAAVQLAKDIATPLPQPQLLNLRFLSLEGIALGDKGAVALAAALQTNQHLQVLCLGRCGLRDVGGAAVCRAVHMHPSMVELDISWNALSHQTSKAVASAFRCPSCRLSSLSMSHCGLDDKDGALILDALLPAGSSNSSSGGSNSILVARFFTFLDLSYNTLEGGAALCASALISAIGRGEIADIAQEKLQLQPPAASVNTASMSGSILCSMQNARGCNRGLHATSICEDATGLGGCVLLLDGNPLGASGVKSIMRALAGQPAVGVLLREVHGSGTNATPAGACAVCNSAAPLYPEGFFLQCEHGATEAAESTAKTAKGIENGNTLQQQTLASPLHVGIAKVALMAKEKGFRSSMRDAQSAMVLASQVPTLMDALVPPSTSLTKGQGASGKEGAATKTNQSNQKAAKPAAADIDLSDSTKSGLLVVTETAAGFDLCCPAGQYRLSLTHPAVQHMLGQLLELRTRLQQLQQQVKLQQEQQTALAAAARASSSGARSAAKVSSSSGAVSGGRKPSPAPPASNSPPGGGTPMRGGSQHVTTTGSNSGDASTGTTVGASRPSTAQSAAKSGVLVKRHFLNCTVDIPTLVEIKLDGKAVKLEQLLQLQPWRRSSGAVASSSGGTEACAGQDSLAITAGSAALTAVQDVNANQGTSTKAKRPKSYKQLEFTVRAAAVLAGQEAPVMPEQLLQWAVKVLSEPSCTEVWKLQLVQLLVPDWLLRPEQMVQLLGVFDKELGQEEKLSAAGLMWARLVQPMDFWEHVMPTSLKPLQQQRFKDMLGPQLMALDRQNLTGPYVLNLGWSVHRAVAQRLQVAALQDIATSECRYYLSWRNASLNGKNLDDKALAQLQAYAVPSSGSLRLDYVSYQVPDINCTAALQDQFKQLLHGLRQQQGMYYRQVLALREEYLPGGQRKSEEEERQTAAKARVANIVRDAVMVYKPGLQEDVSMQMACYRDAGEVCGAANTGPLLPTQLTTWWEASRLDPTPLLLKYQDSNIPGLQSLLSSCCLPPPTGQTRSRRSTKDLDTVVPGVGVLCGAKPQDRNRSRSSSGATGGLAAAAAAAAGGSRPASASRQAADSSAAGSRRTNHSKQQLRSPLLFPSANGGNSMAGTAVGAGTAPGTAGGTPLDNRGVTDEELLVRLLVAATPAQAASALSLMGSARVASVLLLLAGMPRGAAAVALLLECISPVVAARCLQDIGHDTAQLPAELRARVELLMKPAVAEMLRQVGSLLCQAAAYQWNQQLLLVRCFATQVPGISCDQLGAILGLLGAHGVLQRSDVVVALWSKVTDRHRLVEVFAALSGTEQLGLMTALGSYHVWATLACPDGLHFRLDLTNPEQRDVAREVVKVAVRRSLAERAATGQRVRQLENFTAEGKPVADPEDDKLWLSMESKHRLLEFDFARTWEQELHRMVGAVKHIQRAWRKRSVRKGHAPNVSGAASHASTRPVTPTTAAMVAGGSGLQAVAQNESSFLVSGQTSSCSYCSGTSGGVTPTVCTETSYSSFMSTSLSNMAFVSELEYGQRQQQSTGLHVSADKAGFLPDCDPSHNIGSSSSCYCPEAVHCSPGPCASSKLPANRMNCAEAVTQAGSRLPGSGAAAMQSCSAGGVNLQTALAQQQAAAGWATGGSSTRPTPRIG